jgi:hypothetical protein
MRKITAGDCVACKVKGYTFEAQVIEYRRDYVADTTEYDVKQRDGVITTLTRKDIIKRIPYFSFKWG